MNGVRVSAGDLRLGTLGEYKSGVGKKKKKGERRLVLWGRRKGPRG